MVLEMFSLFDVKAGAFAQPFYSVNAGMAQRNVAAAMESGEAIFAKFPEDFQLFRVGTFNDLTGLVEAVTPPHCVCVVSSLGGKNGRS